MHRTVTERHESEIAYFDRQAEAELHGLEAMDPAIFKRYESGLRKIYNREYRFIVAGSLEGDRVLEIGCGNGESAVLLARRGAHVTGIDISPKSIEVARARARVAGVGHRCEFVSAPILEADVPESSFDVIWGDGILHHVIDELDAVMRKVVTAAKPNARVMFAEPVNLSPTFRKIRLMLPIPLDGTPDERPLEPSELAIVRRYVPDAHERPFMFLSRTLKLILARENYEHASALRRGLADVLHAFDYAMLSRPAFRRLAGKHVIHGHVDKSALWRA